MTTFSLSFTRGQRFGSDLLIIDSHLSFDAHITKTVAKAFTRANLIHKCFTSRDAVTLWRAFVVYVRPLLEYVTCVNFGHHIVWGRLTASNGYNVNSPKGYSLDYKSRLMRLRADSLELRRLRYDLIYTYTGCLWSCKWRC